MQSSAMAAATNIADKWAVSRHVTNLAKIGEFRPLPDPGKAGIDFVETSLRVLRYNPRGTGVGKFHPRSET